MAKKSKSSKRKAAAQKPSRRVGERTATDIREYVARLDVQRGALLALAQAMEEQGLASARLDGVTKIGRGLDLIEDFTILLESAIKRAVVAQRREP